MYLTYDEYIDMGGETLEETAFDNLEFEARATIDWWTFNRLQNEVEYPEAVKRCMFALIRLIKDKQDSMVTNAQASDGTKQAGITHQSNDGVSTSYNVISARSAVEMIKQDIQATIKMYLHGVRNSLGQKVLYRGIYPNE